MGKGLGLGTVSEKPFLEIFNMALPHVKHILDEMCEEAKQLMKDILDKELGSWARGVTSIFANQQNLQIHLLMVK